jgi:uncharacterized protein YdeI (YjbR/CyaY-like superfamily)
VSTAAVKKTPKTAAKAERIVDDAPVEFANAAALVRWYKRHHGTHAGVWLRIAKKASGIASIDHPEALEIALCFGWIDGQRKSDTNDGERYFLQRFTPRTARSTWSKINRDKALKLIDEERMQPGGLAEVERAKADGRWDAAYDAASVATVPPDLQAALDANKKAAKFFATLDARNRYAVLFRTQGAKKAETRARRIAKFVEMLAKGEKIHP